MMGIEQAGLAETIDFVLKKFPDETQNKLVQVLIKYGHGFKSQPCEQNNVFSLFSQHIFLTGGPSSFPNFRERLERDLLALRPFKSKFGIYQAGDPVLDAWTGARQFALQPGLPAYSITREDYLEKGGEYLKEHACANQYFPTPAALPDSKAASQELSSDQG